MSCFTRKAPNPYKDSQITCISTPTHMYMCAASALLCCVVMGHRVCCPCKYLVTPNWM